MADTDASLLARWSDQGDPVAFNEIASRHGTLVYTVCKRILGGVTEAEQVAQECFTFLANRSGAPVDHLGAWLHAVAVNRSLVRAKRDRIARPGQSASAPTDGSPVEWSDVFGYVDEAIIELPGYLRVLAVAYFLQDRSAVEIAQNVGETQQKVNLHLTTAVERMARYVSEHGVRVTGSELKSLIGVNATEAVPATLAVKLGEGALAAPAPSKHIIASAEPDITVSEPKSPMLLVAVAVVFLAVLGAWWVFSRGPTPEEKQAQDAQATQQDTGQAEDQVDGGRPSRTREVARPQPKDRHANGRPTPRAGAKQPVAATRTISGTVRNQEGGPVADALVFVGSLPPESLRTEEKAAAKTVPSGTFELEEVSAQAKMATVWHPLYLPEEVSLEAGATGPVAVTLSPAAVLEGVITLAGQPLAGQEVTVKAADSPSSARAKTEMDGSYRISSLPAGLLRISASVKGPDGTRTMVRAGESEEGQITIVDFHFGGLSVTLQGAVYVNDEPARSATIVAFVENADGATEEFRAGTGAEGEYQFEHMAAGPTTLQVRGIRIGSTEHARAAVLQTQPGAAFQQDFDLRGTGVVVVDVAGLPVGASGFVAALPGGTALPELTREEVDRIGDNVLAKTTLRGDGQYILEGLEGSNYTICAIAMPPVKTAAPGEPPQLALYDGVTLNVADGAEIGLALSPR